MNNNYKKIYPIEAGGIAIDKKNRVLFSTPSYGCGYFVNHKTKDECKAYNKKKGPIVDKVMVKNVKKSWATDTMFAYVKDNCLYITGDIVRIICGKRGNYCYNYDTTLQFFVGMGNQIKEVVGREQSIYDYYNDKVNIFVLLKDGSVWGIGDNKRKLISGANSDEIF